MYGCLGKRLRLCRGVRRIFLIKADMYIAVSFAASGLNSITEAENIRNSIMRDGFLFMLQQTDHFHELNLLASFARMLCGKSAGEKALAIYDPREIVGSSGLPRVSCYCDHCSCLRGR
jgi:hypothetical protein